MRMFVPELGTVIVLERDWPLTVHDETRNLSVYDDLAAEAGVPLRFVGTSNSWRSHDGPGLPLVLPAGTELRVDRIYIRKGAEDFSSLTFIIESTTHPVLAGSYAGQPRVGARAASRKRRFWAKLEDVNRMEIRDVA